MSRLTLHRLLAAAFAAFILWPSPAHAEIEDGSWELGGGVAFVLFDDNTVLDPDYGANVSVGYSFTKKHMGEIQFTGGTASEDRGPALKIDYSILRLGYVYNSFPKEKRVTFFKAGVGIQSIEPDEFTGSKSIAERLQDDSDDFLVYAGGGIRWYLTDRLAIRLAGSLDLVDGGEDGILNPDIQATMDLGVSFLLGGGDGGTEAVPAAEPDDSGDDGETESGQ